MSDTANHSPAPEKQEDDKGEGMHDQATQEQAADEREKSGGYD